MDFRELVVYYRRKSTDRVFDVIDDLKKLTDDFERAEYKYSKAPENMLRMFYSYVVVICDTSYQEDFADYISMLVDSKFKFNNDTFEASFTRKMLAEDSRKDPDLSATIVKIAAALYGLSEIPLERIPYNAFESWPN